MERLKYLETEILGKPITWGRPVDHRGRRLNPERYRNWKDAAASKLAAVAKLRSFPPASEVVAVLDLWPDRVKVSLAVIDDDDKRRPGSGLRGDVDNYAKAVLDALQAAGVLVDDRQVVDLQIRIRKDPK